MPTGGPVPELRQPFSRSAFYSNECRLVDFLQRGDTGKNVRKSRLAKECHSPFMRCTLDFRCRPPFDDHFADVVRQIQQFMNGGPAPIAAPVAFQTTIALVKHKILVLFRIESRLHKGLRRVSYRPPALGT